MAEIARRPHIRGLWRVYWVMNMSQPFEQAVQRHGATVLRVCRAVVGSEADAEDVWSETFLAALRVWPELDAGTNVEAWLVRVAQRKAVDLLRARARHATPTERVPDGQSTDGIPDGVDLDLWAAVRRLPERQRLALAYHYLGGLPHAETAELIGGSPAAVRRAAADGIAALRRTYGTDHSTKGAPR